MTTLLLVDDVDLFLELERSFLEGLKLDLATARSGDEALERLEELSPALVLLDLYMPGMDGDEVCRRIRTSGKWRNLPVIMVTAGGRKEEIQRCLDAGCDDYVTKPIDRQELCAKVRNLLGLAKSRSAARTPAAIRVHLKGDGKKISARARDISANGIYVRSRTVLRPGTVVNLSLELPDGTVLPVPGKVKRVQKGPDSGMGIYFIRPAPHSLKSMEEWLATQNGESAAPKGAPEKEKDLREENGRLHLRIAELEAENREFADLLVHTEEANNNLTNLYIASTRLHSVLNRAEVTEIIKEVVINFVGAEKFALLLLDKDGRQLVHATGEGFEENLPPVPLEEGMLGELVRTGESYFQEGSVREGSDDPGRPIAAIPLSIHGEVLGLLAIYKLFTQKEQFQPVDYQLFSMMAEHAATALFSSTLYEESERKRETYRGFMDLLLK